MKPTFIVLLALCLCLPVVGADKDKPLPKDLKSLKALADKGDAEAQYQLAEALFWGIGGNQDLKQAAVWSRASAKQGNAKGEYRLAVQLLLGQGMESTNENDKEGFEWLAKASEGLQKLADQCDHDAQHKLALLYLSGLIKGAEDNPYAVDRKKIADLMEKAANGGNVSSQFRLGLIHRLGLTGKPSNEKAIVWFRKAADNGSAYAAYDLWMIWMMFKQLQVQPVKLEEAKRHLKTAAEQGLATAQHQCGIALVEGLLGRIDQKAGIGWVKKAAEQGLAPAQMLLGATLTGDKILNQDLASSFVWLSLASSSQSGKVRSEAKKFLAGIRDKIAPANRLDLYFQQVKKFRPKKSLVTRNFDLGLQGAGSDITFPMRVDLLTAVAHEGNVAAMVTLGGVYRKAGKIWKSIVWLEKAAKKENKNACVVLAQILLTGNDVTMNPNVAQGIKWLRKAAELGDVRSMNGLGEYIINGEVKGIKPEEGVKWITKAADNGLASAQTNLGRMYINGDLMGQDFPKAKKWLQMAARQNFHLAQFELGLFLFRGLQQGKPDLNGAIHWYRRAARQGNERAQFELAMMYKDGIGVKQSFYEGYKWMIISQRHGMKGIDRPLAMCAQKLTSNELREAFAKAKRFRARNDYHPDEARK